MTKRELGKLKRKWNEILAQEFASKKGKRRRRKKAAKTAKVKHVKRVSKRAQRRGARLRVMSYKQYIHSREWRRLRNKRAAKAGGVCETCGKRGWQVHHVRYPNGQDWSLDRVANLRLLCGTCHMAVHGIVLDVATQQAIDTTDMDMHAAETATFFPPNT